MSQSPNLPLRLLVPDRDVVIPASTIELLLPADHFVRTLWQFVLGLDVAALLDQKRCFDGHAGRPAIDPRVLIALWLQATLDAVGSARQLQRLCSSHLTYRWIVGDVPVAYHTLSDFRVDHGQWLDDTLSAGVAALIDQGLVSLETIALDGIKIRASAGTDTFRRLPTLEKLHEQAREHVESLKRQDDETASAASARQKEARERGARERLERVESALKAMPALQAGKESNKKGTAGEARASASDPEARRMKMGDGGYRPAYNGQVAVDASSGFIVDVAASNQATDAGLLGEGFDRIEARYEQTPEKMLVDSGYGSHEDLERLTQADCEVYSPPKNEQKELEQGKNPYEAKRGDSKEVKLWRGRMGTAQAKALYKKRGESVEWANAWLRRRGLYGISVRGRRKATTILTWQAVAHNFWRAESLRRGREEESHKKSAGN